MSGMLLSWSRFLFFLINLSDGNCDSYKDDSSQLLKYECKQSDWRQLIKLVLCKQVDWWQLIIFSYLTYAQYWYFIPKVRNIQSYVIDGS